MGRNLFISAKQGLQIKRLPSPSVVLSEAPFSPVKHFPDEGREVPHDLKPPCYRHRRGVLSFGPLPLSVEALGEPLGPLGVDNCQTVHKRRAFYQPQIALGLSWVNLGIQGRRGAAKKH